VVSECSGRLEDSQREIPGMADDQGMAPAAGTTGDSSDALGMNEDWGDVGEDDDDDADMIDGRGGQDGFPAGPGNGGDDFSESSGEDAAGAAFALHNAAEKGDLERIEVLLKEHMESGQYLLRASQINEMPEEEATRREIMARLWKSEWASKLLSKRDQESCTPLHVAVLSRQLESFKLLLKLGSRTSTRCNNAPLIHLILGVGSLAAHHDFALAALKVLLAHVPDKAAEDPIQLDARDDLRRTCVHLTAEFSLPEMLLVIQSHETISPDLWNAKDLEGRTVAHIACKVGEEEVLKSALSACPKLASVPDLEGMLPIHVAANYGFDRGVAILMELDKSLVDALDARGRKALDWATLHEYQSTVAVLSGDSNGSNDGSRKSKTLIFSHEVCSKHYTCHPRLTSRRGLYDVPPENVNRLKVLLDADMGILRSKRLSSSVEWMEASRANIADILRVHDYSYVNKLQKFTDQLSEDDIGELDGDTSISGLSFEAAMFAAGSVCDAIDAVCAGTHRNAFCAVRPPGHHAGPRGVVTCKNDPNGSYGFCLLSNAAIGAAYARHVHRISGVKKVAIVDFDVHHGNGTEACVKNLTPSVHRTSVDTPFCDVEVATPTYKPWLNEKDGENVFFASIHGYGKRMPGLDPDPAAPPRIGMFYPSDGPNFGFGDYGKPQAGEPAILDVGQNSKSRMEWRYSWRKHVLPALAAFEPDLIIISAGFDAHKEDDINMGYISALEHDYYWLTNQLVKIANKYSKGRIVSVLEGGYKIQGQVISPFARSVCSHVAALTESSDKEKYDASDADWEQSHEEQLVASAREAAERQRYESELARTASSAEKDDAAAIMDDSEPSRKRSRRSSAPVDYKALNDQLNQEIAQAKLANKDN